MRYTTRQDAIEQSIVPALAQDTADYDLGAICNEAYAWTIEHDGAGNELLNTGGFVQVVTDEEFWAIVAKHAR